MMAGFIMYHPSKAAVASTASKGWLAKSCDTRATSPSRLAAQRSFRSTLLAESIIYGLEESVVKRAASRLMLVVKRLSHSELTPPQEVATQ